MTILQYIAFSELKIHHSEWPSMVIVEPINDPIYYRILVINRRYDDPLLLKDSKDESKIFSESKTWKQIDAIMKEYNDQDVANVERREALQRNIRNGLPLEKALRLRQSPRMKRGER